MPSRRPLPDVKQLAIHQGAIADKYTKLEKLLEDMARIEAVNDPRRAALLMKGLELSKENLTGVKLNKCVTSLEQFEAKNKAEREGLLGLQREAHQDMKALLEMLLSENRSDRLKREQDRIREYIKEVERILRLQKSVQGRTEGGAEQSELAKDQGKVADRTGELAKQIRENEEGGDQSRPTANPATRGKVSAKAVRVKASPPSSRKPSAQAKEKAQGKDENKEQAQGKDQSPGRSQDRTKSPPRARKAGQGQGKDQGQSKEGGQKQDSGKPGRTAKGQGKQGKAKSKTTGPRSAGSRPGPGSTETKTAASSHRTKAIRPANASRPRRSECARRRSDSTKRSGKTPSPNRRKPKKNWRRPRPNWSGSCGRCARRKSNACWRCSKAASARCWKSRCGSTRTRCRLDKVVEAERDLKIPIPAGKLAIDERKLVVEADKALNSAAGGRLVGRVSRNGQPDAGRYAAGLRPAGRRQGGEHHAGHRAGHHRRAAGDDRSPAERPKRTWRNRSSNSKRSPASRRTCRWSTPLPN